VSLIRKLVRDHDRDRYVAALFLDKRYQTKIFPILAFNVELERIPQIVTEPQLGEIRLQWWRDTLEKIARGERVGHPVADSMAVTLARSDISTVSLLEMIDARSFDISRTIFPDFNALNSYFNKTTGAVFSLSEQIILDNKISSRELVERAGRAYGLMQIMKLLPYHTASGRIFIPQDILNEFGVDRVQLLGGQESSGLNRMLTDLRNRCRQELKTSRSLLEQVGSRVSTAYLPLALVDPYLTILERNSHNPLTHLAVLNPLQRLWLLWRGTRTSPG